jgi:hypothetical protein
MTLLNTPASPKAKRKSPWVQAVVMGGGAAMLGYGAWTNFAQQHFFFAALQAITALCNGVVACAIVPLARRGVDYDPRN